MPRTPRSLSRFRAVWAALSARPRSSVRELMAATGLTSSCTVHHYLRLLYRSGYVRPGPRGRARARVVVIPLVTM